MPSDTPDPPRARAAIFDLDGVLVSSTELHYAAYRKTFASEGREFSRDAYHEFGVGASRDDVIRRVMGDLPPEELSRLMEAKERYVREHIEERGIDAIPGAVEFARAVRARGVRTAVASASRTAELLLRAIGADGLFDCVIGRHHVKRSKPHPDLYLKAAEALGVPPSACLVIEDAPRGIQAARAAGMRVLALATTEPPERLAAADAVFSGFSEIRLDDWFA
ncbi:MAG: HAD family hydrolase [Planctomycetota bacterium]